MVSIHVQHVHALSTVLLNAYLKLFMYIANLTYYIAQVDIIITNNNK